MDPLTKLLADLVAIPSVNPMGRSVSGPAYLEGRLTDYLEHYCRERNIPCVRMPISPGRENLIARYDAPGSSRTLLFDAHQDTVPVEGMTIPPFEPHIAGGRLYGRGSCDVKGSLAAMLGALERLCRERPSGTASVWLACTVDEEFTHTGSSRLAESPWAKADLAIVAEPTRMDIITTHKGAVRWKIRTRGVACHSSSPGAGRNAIYTMARVIAALEEHAQSLANGPRDPILGPPSLSVGRIEGGQSVNIVPDRCEIEIDRRVIPGEVGENCPAQVERFLADRLGSLEEVETLPPWVNMPPLAPRVGAEAVEAIANVIQRVTGRKPAVGGVPFGTDAGPLNQAGLPCVVLGPGDIAQAHTKDEWIELEQVHQAAEVYYQLARATG